MFWKSINSILGVNLFLLSITGDVQWVLFTFVALIQHNSVSCTAVNGLFSFVLNIGSLNWILKREALVKKRSIKVKGDLCG